MPSATRLAALTLLLCPALTAEVRTLTILHTNDMHSRLMPLENKRGGFAYLASVIRRERANCHDCILLNAGDVAQGTPVSTIFHGLPVFEIANLLGFDAATLGNHDFDYGWMQTRKFMSTAKYPIVSSNIVNAKGELFTGVPYVILNVNGLRVAVLGAMTDSLKILSVPKLLGEWRTTPVVETVRKYARDLKEKSDLIVLLSHITGEEELNVLSHIPEIPVTVSGHLHSGLPQALNAELLHAAGVGVILDAPYGHQEDREAVQELEPLWVECRVSAEEAVRRFRERGFDRERPDLTEDVVRRAVAEYKYSGGALVLDTEQIDLEDCVERVTGELRRLSKGQARRPTKRVTPEG